MNDDHESIRCLKQAESKAATPDDWTSLARSWAVLFNNDLEASRCIRKSEEMEKSSDGFDMSFNSLFKDD